ncbi:MAG TPA: tail fiber domain-containing protein, partial [Allocoleopsis sp.]
YAGKIEVSNTLLSFLTINNFTSSSVLRINDFTSSLLLDTTAFNNTLTSRLSSYSTITSVSNINTTIPSLLSISSFTSASLLNTNAFNNTLTSSLNNYLPLTTYNNTTLSLINNINNTIPSLLLTNNFNTTIGSYLKTYSNGVVDCTMNNASNNKKIVLWDGTPSDNPSTSVSFIGFGLNPSTLRYQVDASWGSHRMFCATKAVCNFTSNVSTIDSNLNVVGNLTITGTSSLLLNGSATQGSRIQQTSAGDLNFNVNISNASTLALSLYSNGVVNVNGNNFINNKQLVLYENASGDAPSTAINFSGIGIQSGGAMRYQVPTATSTHRFFCGTTQSFFITNGSGASGSDMRFKSEIENINNAMEKINNIQGKTFIFQQNPRKQLGFIAQDLFNIIPEVIITDED